jgi:hypothetical protein
MSHDFQSTGSNAYAYEVMASGQEAGNYTVVRTDGRNVDFSVRRGHIYLSLEFDAAKARAVAAQLIAAADVAEATAADVAETTKEQAA